MGSWRISVSFLSNTSHKHKRTQTNTPPSCVAGWYRRKSNAINPKSSIPITPTDGDTLFALLWGRKKVGLKHSWASNHWTNKDRWLDDWLAIDSGEGEAGEILSLHFKRQSNGSVSVSAYTFLLPCDRPAAFRKFVKKHHFSSRWRISVIFG